jgi:hypothetical protein
MDAMTNESTPLHENAIDRRDTPIKAPDKITSTPRDTNITNTFLL